MRKRGAEMAKRAYYEEMEQMIATTQPGSTLLLHSCCGPCSTGALERLGGHFAVTLYFYNPNILPEDEYQRRVETQKLVVEGIPTRYPVTLLEGPYDVAAFVAATRGLEAEPEGGARCVNCFTFRLEEAARLAQQQGFDYFGTTLTTGPMKDAELLNGIGEAVSVRYGVAHLPADFKKVGGHQRSVALSEELGLYRQRYCGCKPTA